MFFILQVVQIRSDQSLSCVQLFVTTWIAVHQASLSITNSRSSLRLTSIESVMPSSHLILCRPLLLLPQSLPASESFPMSQHFAWGGQSTGVSASALVLPMNTQDWSPLEWTGWISLGVIIIRIWYQRWKYWNMVPYSAFYVSLILCITYMIMSYLLLLSSFIICHSHLTPFPKVNFSMASLIIDIL